MSAINNGAPSWAKPLTDSEFQVFMQGVDEYFTSKGAQYNVSGDAISFTEGADGGFGEAVFGLSNLAQSCKGMDSTACHEAIRMHFEAFFSALEFDREFKQMAGNLEYAQSYLAVRIYDKSFIDGITGDKPIFRELDDALHEVLVFDLPQVIELVKQQYLESWGVSADELFSIGISNILSNYNFTVNEHEFEGMKVFIVGTDHYFAADILYALDSHPDLVGSYGSLVSFPTRGLAMFHPIESTDAIFFSVRMADVTEAIFLDGPGSLSSRLFRYHDGKLSDITPGKMLVDGKQSRVLSSPELISLMEQIVH